MVVNIIDMYSHKALARVKNFFTLGLIIVSQKAYVEVCNGSCVL